MDAVRVVSVSCDEENTARLCLLRDQTVSSDSYAYDQFMDVCIRLGVKYILGRLVQCGDRGDRFLVSPGSRHLSRTLRTGVAKKQKERPCSEVGGRSLGMKHCKAYFA